MKHIPVTVLIFFSCISSSAFAQNGFITVNNASLTVTTTPSILQFDYNTLEELISGKEITNAIHLTVMMRNQSCNVTAMLNYANVPGTPGTDWLATKFVNMTSASNSVLNADVTSGYIDLVPNVNIPLLTQPAQLPANMTKYYTYNYNLKLKPRTTFVQPGQYNFAITYTMTAL